MIRSFLAEKSSPLTPFLLWSAVNCSLGIGYLFNVMTGRSNSKSYCILDNGSWTSIWTATRRKWLGHDLRMTWSDHFWKTHWSILLWRIFSMIFTNSLHLKVFWQRSICCPFKCILLVWFFHIVFLFYQKCFPFYLYLPNIPISMRLGLSLL